MARVLFLAAMLLGSLALATAYCPYNVAENAGLVAWSSASSWSGGSAPAAGAAVTIPAGTKMLYDLTAGTFASITVLGSLVFKNSAATLTVGWIRVSSGGSFIMGDKTCKLTAKITVSFTGTRPPAGTTDTSVLNLMGVEPTDLNGFGKKGMAIAAGATIELHAVFNGPAWSRLSATADAGATTLTLEDDVSTWAVGARIAIANTDFSATPDGAYKEQSEDRVIASVSGKVVTLTAALTYQHWGAGNQKAEVGILTRNIVFQGDPTDATTTSDRYGGHLLIRNAINARISGIEFTKMGQQGVVGRYPVHFHRLYNRVGGDVYVKDSSSHDNFQRGFVIHDSDGLLVDNNVGYNTIGHMYFLEDGSEQSNTFNHNLAIRADPVKSASGWYAKIVPTDDAPAMFWVTNPNNTYTNNAACGGEFGFWYSLPTKPNGLSTDSYANNDWVSPRYQQMGLNAYNTAHSANRNGLMIDDMQLMDGTTELGSWSPRIGPYPQASYSSLSWMLTPAPGTITGFKAYKNRETGIWIRGSHNIVRGATIEDNQCGILIVPGPNIVRDTLIVGETDNLGLASNGPTWLAAYGNRGRPVAWTNNYPIIGWSGYDAGGPQFAYNIVFKNFVTNTLRPAGALGALINGINMLHSADQLAGLTFVNSNKAFYPVFPQPGIDDAASFKLWDGPKGHNFMDRDGSVTGSVGGWIVGKIGSSFMIDSSLACTEQTSMNAYFCPSSYQPYLHVAVMNTNTDGTNFGSFTAADGATRVSIYRFGTTLNDATKIDLTGQDYYTPNRDRFEVNLRSSAGYAMIFAGGAPTPPNLRVQLHSAAEGEWVVWAIPYTTATTFTITQGYDARALTQVSSLQLLTSTTYYFDTSSKFLYLKVQKKDGEAPEQLDDFLGYGGYDIYYDITASCGNACAFGTVAIPATVASWGKTAAIYEDHYFGTMTASAAGTGSTNTGKVYITYNPTEHYLTYAVYHTIDTTTVTGAQLHVGSPSGTGVVVLALVTGISPARGAAYISYATHQQLYGGFLYAHVHSAAYPVGEIRAQMVCDTATWGTCSAPLARPSPDPCLPLGSNIIWVYRDALVGVSSWSWNLDIQDYANVETPMACAATGNKQIKLSTLSGAMSLHVDAAAGLTVPPATYAYLEFFVRSAVSLLQLDLWVETVLGSGTATGVRITSDYILGYAIEDTWTRVRIPIAKIGLTAAAPTFDRITFMQYQSWNNKPTITFYLDSIAFTQAVTETVKLDGAWSAWSACSLSCQGTQTRTCTAPAPSAGGAACPSTDATTQACNTQCNTPVPGAWSAWGTCTVACGGGTQTRTCTNPAPSYGGATCSGVSVQDCGTAACTLPIAGGWSAYGACSATCGGTKTRTCTNPTPLNGGAACDGVSTLSCTACSAPAIAGGWGDWGACTASCGTGSQLRQCNNPAPSGGGAACSGASAEACNTLSCAGPVDGGWTLWSTCSKLCGGGVSTRACTNPVPTNGGAACSGVSTTACNTPSCLGAVTVSLQLAVDYTQYTSDAQKTQFNTQIISDIADSLGISPTLLSVTSVVDLGNGRVTVNLLLSGASSAGLASQLLGMVSNSSSALYDPSRALTTNTLGSASSGSATTTTTTTSSSDSGGLGMGAMIGIAIGGAALVALVAFGYCHYKRGNYEKKKANLAAAQVQLGTPTAASASATTPKSPSSSSSSPANAAAKQGWTKVWDEGQKAHYWFNTNTNVSQWTPPTGWTD